MEKSKKMKKSNLIILILSLFCICSVTLMIIGLCVNKTEKAKFAPPQFDTTAKIGIPSKDETERFGWAEISQDGMPYKTAVCGNICIDNGDAFIYLTNYSENSTWLKLRIYDSEGKIVAETGLVKPGEYIEKIHFVRVMQDAEKIKLKIMAYEPETYYSAGSVVLNTAVKTGEG